MAPVKDKRQRPRLQRCCCQPAVRSHNILLFVDLILLACLSMHFQSWFIHPCCQNYRSQGFGLTAAVCYPPKVSCGKSIVRVTCWYGAPHADLYALPTFIRISDASIMWTEFLPITILGISSINSTNTYCRYTLSVPTWIGPGGNVTCTLL